MNQPVTLTMAHRYPFDYITKDNQIIGAVKLRRRFQQYEYPHLRSKIQVHSNIKHHCLIKIIKAFQSRKKGYFDIVFEWIPYSLRYIARSLNYAELQEKKLALLELVQKLIRSGLHPAIAQDLIGVTQNKQIKLYVDVDFSPIIGPAEELIRAKQIQISNIFKLYQRASLFELPRSPRNSMHQILGNQSHYLQNSKFLSPQPVNQNRDIYLDKMKKSKSPIIISKKYDNQIIQQVRRFPQLLKGSTQKTLFGSISNIVSGNQNQGPSIQQAINSQNSFQNYEQKQLKIQKSETDRKQNIKYESKQIQNKILQDKQDKQDKIEIMRQPRLFKLTMKQQQKQQSEEQSISIVDTYKQELGQTIKMPKLSNAQFRQTTKEPPIIMNFSEQKARKMSITNSDLKDFRKQKSKSPIKSQDNNQIKTIKKQEQVKKKTQYTAQNSYYYKQILGIGTQKNNPITQQFISLLGDDFMIQTPNFNQSDTNTFQQKKQQKIQPKPSNLNQINDKVKQALQNSQKTFDMFQKFKQNQEK